MTRNNISVEYLVKKHESAVLEFKSSFAEMSDILKTICAFANHKSGIILIGVSDEGRIVGLFSIFSSILIY